MVYALSECWRVLRPGGGLVDLRPIASGWKLEIVQGERGKLAGRLDDSLRRSTDAASNQAMAQAVALGWFKPRTQDSFAYAYYWDDLEGMQAYVEAEWPDSAVIPENVLREAARLVREAVGESKIRITRTIWIATYERAAPGG